MKQLAVMAGLGKNLANDRTAVIVQLFVEYESVCKRKQHALDAETVDDILNYLALAASQHDIFDLWRPILKDPKDDHVLELAITEKMAAFLTRDYLEARAKQASEARFLAALAKVPDVEPEAADRLPKGN